MEWIATPGLTLYPDALDTMAARVAAIQQGTAEELVWLVEHPPIYTLGTSAKPADLLDSTIPTYPTGRGGQVTYHGPGQRVAYVLRDLKRHPLPDATGPDLRAYVRQLERWMILTLAEFGVEGFVRHGRVGVWVAVGNSEAKIGAIGVRVQRWVTSHGISLNVRPDLTHYQGIVPCGIRAYGVTSLTALGVAATMAEVDAALRKTWPHVLG